MDELVAYNEKTQKKKKLSLWKQKDVLR